VRGLAVVVSLGILVSTCSGCSPSSSDQDASPETSSTAKAVYSSRQEASQELQALYVNYTAALAKVARSGGGQGDAIAEFVTPAQYKRDTETFARFAASGRHITGAAKVRSFRLQRVDLVSGAASAYVCVDVEKSRVLDARDRDVTPKNRASKQALVISFVRGPLIKLSNSWSGPGVC
jgi:hypothetical protein